MADSNTVVHIGENSVEQVAFKLLEHVRTAEGKTFHQGGGDRHSPADRKWILDTYAECLETVKGYRSDWKQK